MVDRQEATMADEPTQALAAYAATLDLDAIPDAVRAQCKNLLLDALACAVAGHAGEETPQVAAFATALAPGADTSIIGGERLSLTGATILNAFLITAVTMSASISRPFGPRGFMDQESSGRSVRRRRWDACCGSMRRPWLGVSGSPAAKRRARLRPGGRRPSSFTNAGARCRG
jgi:hypothetical protein